jgi:hypothetical protein
MTNENQRAGLAGSINFNGCLIDLYDNVLNKLGPDLCFLLSDLLFILFLLFPLSVRILFSFISSSVFLWLFWSDASKGSIFVVVFLLIVILVISNICITGVALSLDVLAVHERLLLLLIFDALRLIIAPINDPNRIQWVLGIMLEDKNHLILWKKTLMHEELYWLSFSG